MNAGRNSLICSVPDFAQNQMNRVCFQPNTHQSLIIIRPADGANVKI
jgi:hypothetical protein